MLFFTVLKQQKINEYPTFQLRYNRGTMHSTLQKRHSLAGLFAGLAAASIWGGMYVVSKVVLEVIPPFALLTTRYILGAATLGGVIYFRNKRSGTKFVLTKEFFWKSALVGFVGYGISLGFQFVGTKLSTASNGSLVTCATPAFVLLFAPFLLGERATTRGIIALIVSTLGVIAVIDPRNAELSPTLFWGNISLLAAAVTWALYSVLVRKVSKSGDLLTSSTVMLLGGLPSSMLLGFWEVRTQGIGTDHHRHYSWNIIFGDHLHSDRDVHVELCFCRITRQRCFADVLCPARSGYASRMVFPL